MTLPSTSPSKAESDRPFVGRDAELAVIDAALDAFETGGCSSLVLVGEPGIGKTELLRHLRARATARTLRVVSGSGGELEGEMPYATAIDALEDELASLTPAQLAELTTAQIAELAAVLPSLAGGARPAAATLHVSRHRRHRAVAALLELLAAERPLVLVLDDLHWADGASLELVAHLLRRGSPRVLLVLACRSGHGPDLLTRVLGHALRQRDVHHLELGPLDLTAAHALLAGIDPAQRREIMSLSGGNPFYLLQLAAAVRAGGGVPAALRAALLAELTALSPAARTLVHTAALLGDSFDTALAAEVAELDADGAAAALDELLARDLVRGGEGTQRCSFRHPIVRTIVAGEASPSRRAAAHARAAAALAARGAPVTVRAHHVERSARPGDLGAVDLLVAAADATADTAPGAAADWYEAAARLLPPDAALERRLPLLSAQALALIDSGRTASARAVLVEALELLAPEQADAHVLLLIGLARVENMLSRSSEAIRLLRPALDYELPPATVATVRIELAVAHWRSGDWRRMGEHAKTAADSARKLSDPILYAEANALLATAEQQLGRSALAYLALGEGERTVAALDDEQLSAKPDALVYLGYASHALERYQTSARLFLRLMALTRATGRGFFAGSGLSGLSASLLALGRLEEAERHAEEAVEAGLVLDNPQAVVWAHLQRCRAALARGETATAIDHGEQAMQALAHLPSTTYRPLATCILAAAQIEAGEVELGVARILDPEHGAGPGLRRLAPGWRPYWSALLAETELRRGRIEDARAWTEQALAAATAVGLAGRRADAELAHARLLLALDDPQGALRAAEEAAGAFQVVGRRLDVARAEVVAGEALARSGATAAAIERLRRSYAVFDDAGAARHRDATAHALRELGHRTATVTRRRRPALRSADDLTPREREITALVARGLTNRQIAGQLHLSVRTVESHLTRVFAKLGVGSRTAVAHVLRRGDALS